MIDPRHPAGPTVLPEIDDELVLRAIVACARRRTDERHAERALLQATEDLSVCSVAAWQRHWSDGTTAEKLFVELQRTRLLLREARERAEILAARLERVEPRRRRHYTPPLRYRILEHMKRYMLTVEETARRFLVTPQTIYNWIAEMRRHPDATGVGSKIVAVPPVRRYSSAVRRLVQQMDEAGFGGKRKIAETLLRNAWRISARTVGRIRKEAPAPPGPEEHRGRPTTVRGDHPNHLWLMDLTEIPTLFPFLPLHLMVVLDACSRLPLAAALRLTRPSARLAAGLLTRAVEMHGRPRHLVVDQGSQFTAREFREIVDAHRIRIRYGAVGETHSLGLIDRFFRTLKESLSPRGIRPWSLRDFTRRLHLALVHYAYVRPHASLEGFTPAEVYYGIRGHLPRPVSLPRGRPGDSEPEVPFDFVFLDPVHRAFPVLVPKAA
jgi:transposase InsO family protein